MKRFENINKLWLIPLALLLAVGLYYFPPINSRLAWRVDALRSKIIYFISDNQYELYDVVEDPGEKKNLLGSRAQEASRMKQAIAAWMDSL